MGLPRSQCTLKTLPADTKPGFFISNNLISGNKSILSMWGQIQTTQSQMVGIPHYHLASPPPILTEAWAFMVGEYFRMPYHLCFPSNVVMAGAGSLQSTYTGWGSMKQLKLVPTYQTSWDLDTHQLGMPTQLAVTGPESLAELQLRIYWHRPAIEP